MSVHSELKFNAPYLNLGIEHPAWSSALSRAEADSSVGIRHAVLEGNPEFRIHVAAIPKKVTGHFHRNGKEIYQVVNGSGTLHYGPVHFDQDTPVVEWQAPLPVKSGDRFVIPEGFAHQLCRTGEDELIILFACPDSHLDDSEDRTRLPDAPNII